MSVKNIISILSEIAYLLFKYVTYEKILIRNYFYMVWLSSVFFSCSYPPGSDPIK
jgi:hypothetical protein